MNLQTRIARLQAQSGQINNSLAMPAAANQTNAPAWRSLLERMRGSEQSAHRQGVGNSAAEATGSGFGYRERVVANLDLDLYRSSVEALLGDAADELLGVIDLETSGLGGAGTAIVVLGVLEMDRTRARLRQWVLHRPSAERNLLQHFLSNMSAPRTWISYNGGSFDLPLLAERLRMHGLASIQVDHHLDLLRPVRALFSRSWSNCSQAESEWRLLGRRRVGDLPGRDVPALWQRAVRTRRADLMEPVVQHNADDLLGLAQLIPAVDRALCNPVSSRADASGACRWLLRQGRSEQALTALQSISHDDLRALATRARMAARQGRWEDASRDWEIAAAAGCVESIRALAVHLEHRCRDPQAALEWVRRLPADGDRQRRLNRLLGKVTPSTAANEATRDTQEHWGREGRSARAAAQGTKAVATL